MGSQDCGRRACNPGSPAAPSRDDDPSWTREEIAEVRAPLIADGTATAQDAARLRNELVIWLACDVPADDLDDLVLAVYEAIANATEHAYVDHADGAGPVRLTARRSADSISVTVSDDGDWRDESAKGCGGRGLPVMRMLVQDVHVSRNRGGTVVHFRARVQVVPGGV